MTENVWEGMKRGSMSVPVLHDKITSSLMVQPCQHANVSVKIWK